MFYHDASRSFPIYDLKLTIEGEGERSVAGISPANTPTDLPIPVIAPAPVVKPYGWLTWKFLTSYNSYDPFDAGIMAALWGSIWLIGLTTLMSVPLGVGAAVYLEEYSKPTLMTRLIRLNIANLAGVPSIVLWHSGGDGLFPHVRNVRQREDGSDTEASLVSADRYQSATRSGFCCLELATLALLSLPVIIISSQEALRSVPPSLRHAAYALGATKWQTIWHQILPAALPGILTGVILSLSRAIGEAAPLAVIGVAAQLTYAPGRITGPVDVVQHPDKLLRAPFDRFTALPIQVYSWINETKLNFEHVAAAGILVLLVTLLCMNGTAVFIRQRFQQKIRW